MEWLNADTLQLAGIVGIIAFLWSLHRDMRQLSERVAHPSCMPHGCTGRGGNSGGSAPATPPAEPKCMNTIDDPPTAGE